MLQNWYLNVKSIDANDHYVLYVSIKLLAILAILTIQTEETASKFPGEQDKARDTLQCELLLVSEV